MYLPRLYFEVFQIFGRDLAATAGPTGQGPVANAKRSGGIHHGRRNNERLYCSALGALLSITVSYTQQ
jgi:hypothetical protein